MRTTSAFQPRPPVYLRGSTYSLDLESGSSQYAFITDANATGLNITGDMTIEAWVKIESYSSGGNVIVSKDSFPSGSRQYLFYAMEGGADTGKLSFVYWASGSSNETTFRTNSTVLTTGRWHHVVVSVDVSATSVVFYVDGSVVANTKIGGTATSIGSTTVNFNIGRRNDSSSLLFDGLIDDVRVWDDIRTQAEIQDNMLIELQGNETNLQGYWKLNNDYLDATANNNDLTSSGSPVFSGDLPFSTASNTTKAYYPLNGNSRDYSGNTNTGTDTAITYPQGRFGQGAKFNGSTSNILLPAGVVQTGNFTVSAWVKGYTTDDTILSNLDYASDYGWLLLTTSPTNKLTLITFSNPTSGNATTTSADTLKPEKWTNVVGVRNGTDIRVYIDGIQSGTPTAWTSAQIAVDKGTRIGNAKNGAGWVNPFTGLIDEVIIESRAWTAKEVETYYRKSTLNYGKKSFGQIVYTYILELASGSFTLTGISAGLLAGYKIVAQTTSFALTGISVLFGRGFGILAQTGSFALTGTNTILKASYKMVMDTVSFALTGFDVVFKKAYYMMASAGSYILTGFNTMLTRTGWIKSEKDSSSGWGITSKDDQDDWTITPKN